MILAFFLTLTQARANGWDVCGVFLSGDYGDGLVFNITQMSKWPKRQRQFRIMNPELREVRAMMPGLCYCATGAMSVDPAFNGDEDFRLIWIRAISPAYKGCVR